MEKRISICETCGASAKNEKQKRKENWITMNGGTMQGIEVWLEKPRKRKKGVSDRYMHQVGWQDRVYDFCCIGCLVVALKQEDSI